MINNAYKAKVEYGDFQTPLELTNKVCKHLIELGINPDAIVEPTCGVGNFIEAASRFFQSTEKIIGAEINLQYLQAVREKKQFLKDERIELQHTDFFIKVIPDFLFLELVRTLLHPGKLLFADFTRN